MKRIEKCWGSMQAHCGKTDGSYTPTLTAMGTTNVPIVKFENEYVLRKLSPIECERLQGFQDYWTDCGQSGKNMSDSWRYRALGNAVTTNVIEYIINYWEIKAMKYLSLFSGIGGFEVGIQKSTKNMECIGYSEVDKYAIDVYQKHFPNHLSFGDVTKIDVEELPDFDLLVAGFPCQAFSAAGLRRGFNDTRGTLFFEIARILKAKKPKYFLLENVKGLLSHDRGNTFQTIVDTLCNLGYNIRWDVLNSKDFGVPQSRERIYIRGCLGEIPNDISLTEDVGHNIVDYVVNGRQGERILSDEGISHTLAASGGNRGSQTFIKRKKNNNIKIAMQHHFRSNSIFEDTGIAPTLCASNYKHPMRVKTQQKNEKHTQGLLDDNSYIRKLTPLECERLQGFPDNWTKEGVSGAFLSDTQRYKTCGNAVTTNVIKYIMDEWHI